VVKIGITIGDPAGVGPELIVKLSKFFDKSKAYVIYGEKKIIDRALYELNGSLEYEIVYNVSEITIPGVYLVDLNISETDKPLPSITSGKVAVAYLARAVVDAVLGQICGILTMPIGKFWAKLVGFSYEGQTEYLAHAVQTKEYAMMMYSPKVKVVLMSTHVPLLEAIKSLSTEKIIKKVEFVVREYKRLFREDPSIGILGLNPHAGEGGEIGKEDMETILPAVNFLKEQGYKVEGPLPPDAAFLNLEKYSIFLCMYHDQGLIPFKLLSFNEGVNLTLGLPFPRTSPAHGTAYDIAWKGIAKESPSMHALKLCEDLCERLKV